MKKAAIEFNMRTIILLILFIAITAIIIIFALALSQNSGENVSGLLKIAEIFNPSA